MPESAEMRASGQSLGGKQGILSNPISELLKLLNVLKN
jgi:hypothetical protein